jgi:hypothetical protein
VLIVMMLVPLSAHAASISLTLSGGLNFVDADPDLVPTVGPETVTLQVKAVGRRGLNWSLTLIADSALPSDSWAYSTGNYSSTATFTLSAP